MRHIVDIMRKWVQTGRPFVVARVTSTWGSAPRGIGAAMVIASADAFVGSVSGGCVEGAVVQEAVKLLDNEKAVTVDFGVADETAWSVGLSCGGRVELLLGRFPAFSNRAAERNVGNRLITALAHQETGTLVSVLTGGTADHLLVLSSGETVGDERLARWVPQAKQAWSTRTSGWVDEDSTRAFLHVLEDQPRLLIVGAGDISRHLVRMARQVEFETIVIDPRSAFANAEMFAEAPDVLLAEWPETALEKVDVTGETYCVLLSHNPRVDDPALHVFLNSKTRYIGALGSRKTHERRCARLREAGFALGDIERIAGPVGLNIGASTPAEIALSILAEIIAAKNSGTE